MAKEPIKEKKLQTKAKKDEVNDKPKQKSSSKNNKTKNTSKQNETKKHFFKDVKGELKKVRWPLKKEMITYSAATLSIIIILGLFFVACDLIIAGIRMLFI